MNRDDVVVAAMATVEADGHDALSIRGLARELGVSAPTLYDHIESRGQLLRLLAEKGYDELDRRSEAITGTPLEWLLERGRIYVAFAVERPGLFTLMHHFSPSAISGDPVVEHPAASALFEDGLDHIRSAIATGELRPDDPMEIAVSLWAAAHGVATVAIMAPGLDDPDKLAVRVIGGLLEGLRPAGGQSSTPVSQPMGRSVRQSIAIDPRTGDGSMKQRLVTVPMFSTATLNE